MESIEFRLIPTKPPCRVVLCFKLPTPSHLVLCNNLKRPLAFCLACRLATLACDLIRKTLLAELLFYWCWDYATKLIIKFK